MSPELYVECRKHLMHNLEWAGKDYRNWAAKDNEWAAKRALDKMETAKRLILELANLYHEGE